MSHFAANLELLRKVSEPLAARLLDYHQTAGEPTTLGRFAVEPARSGDLTLRCTSEGSEIFVHSPYDPLREAQQYAELQLRENADGNYAVFFGFGLGYGVQELLRRLPADHRVLVFEPHFEVFYLAFCHCDLSTLLTRNLTTFTCDPSIQGAMMTYLNLFELASFTGVRFFSSEAFNRLPTAAAYDELAQRIRYEMTAVSGNIQTLMVMGEMQQTNILLNFPEILDNPPFTHLLGAFQGRPAVIVSAGPSLEKNMHLLKELDQRALIIAVDTSTKPLLQAGITPHVVVTGDPQEANSRHLRGVDLPQTYLIAEPQSPIASLRGWTGPKFICSFHDNMMQWIDRVLGHRGHVLVWGSVAVMAYDVAVKLGADPIVFIGQDLSFPGGRTYAGGTFFETEDRQQMTVDELKTKGAVLIEMTDIYGQSVQTNRQMFAYYNFLKGRMVQPEVRGRRIINATEGGILQGENIMVMPFRQAIDEHMPEPLDAWGILARAHRGGNEINYPNLLLETDNVIATLRGAAESCQRGLDFVGRTLGAIQADDGSKSAKEDVIRCYNRMIALRNRITGNPEVSKMIEMANQTGVYCFARGVKSIKPGESGFDNEFLKRSCYHYHTLYLTTRDAVERLIPPFEAVRDAARQRVEREPVLVE
jgi:hypothetical protein